MSDPIQPDPEEQSFAASVQGGIRQLREERGPCPSSEELAAFFEARLAPEDASRVQIHVEACGLCDLVLGRLGMARDPQASKHTGGEARRWGRLWNPILAYGLAALLAYPAYLGVKQLLGPKAPDESIASAISVPSFSLDAERSTGIAGQTHVVHLTDQPEFFALEFFVPMIPGRHYFAQIRDGAGRVTVSRRDLVSGGSPGRVALVCRRHAFSAGGYTLTIAGNDPSEPRFEYFFQVE